MKDYLVRRIIKNIETRTNGKVHFISHGNNKIIVQHDDYGTQILYSTIDFIFENINYLI